MARLPYVDPEQASEQVRATFDRLPARLNVFRIMAHAETNFRWLVRLGTSILAEQKLDHRLREIAILRVANLSKAAYEWVQHAGIARAVGVTSEQIAALESGDATAGCFNDDEKLVLQFATEVIRDVKASDATFERLAARFSHQEIVELILAIGFYMLMARLLETTAVDLEPDASARLMGTLKKR